MPVKIRLMRIGAKKRPFYRVVAVDERKKRTGEYIELLGTYNPLTEPKDIKLKQDRIDEWLKNGAVPSTGFLRIIGKNPQKPPRKPKREPAPKAEAPIAAPVETVSEEAPAEEVSAEVENNEATPEVTEAQVQTPEETVEAPAEDTPAKVVETPTKSEQTNEAPSEEPVKE